MLWEVFYTVPLGLHMPNQQLLFKIRRQHGHEHRDIRVNDVPGLLHLVHPLLKSFFIGKRGKRLDQHLFFNALLRFNILDMRCALFPKAEHANRGLIRQPCRTWKGPLIQLDDIARKPVSSSFSLGDYQSLVSKYGV